MLWLSQLVRLRPTLKIGVGGNYYVFSSDRDSLEGVCVLIKKSRRSVYFSSKYNCWTIRIKNKQTKQKVKQLFKTIKSKNG